MRKTHVTAILCLVFMATVAYGQGTANLSAAATPQGATPSVGTPQPVAPAGGGAKSVGPTVGTQQPAASSADNASKGEDKPPMLAVEELTLPTIPIPQSVQTPEQKT